MKNFIAAFILLAAVPSFAVSWKVYGPCSEKPVHEGKVPMKKFDTSVGALSVQVFEENKIPYIGSEEGFNSIIGTPTDHNSMEIVSKDEMRAYGWCYSVNGQFPEQMPNEVFFTENNAELVWFYAYSTVKNNQWQEDYCTPAYNIKAPQFCGKK